jgi:magnesium-transporting ATPase (P-type)
MVTGDNITVATRIAKEAHIIPENSPEGIMTTTTGTDFD